MRAQRLHVLAAIALCIVGFLPTSHATHSSGCLPTQADPDSYNVVQLAGELYYFEERGASPPVPGNGLLLGDGSWIYEEANGLGGLQRGGVGPLGAEFPPPGLFPPLIVGADPISDENCGHGPDALVGGGQPEPAPAAPEWVGAFFSRSSPNGAISASGSPGCTLSIEADTATAVCGEGSNASCVSPGLVVDAWTGIVSGSTACTESGTATATAVAPGSNGDIVLGVFAYPWVCTVQFSPGATGSLVCDAPDP